MKTSVIPNWQLFLEQLELIDTSAILKSQNANEINEILVA
jgi:hypothetical protein